jgi:isochorismate hydrolase
VVAPEPADVIVVKKRVSAFAGSDLDVVLRGLGADSLVLTGKVFPRQADVMSIADWTAILS